MSATLTVPAAAAVATSEPRPARGPARWPLAAVVVVCCLLAAVYSAIVPAFEAPDEPGHYAYVEWLLAGQGIPLQGQEPPPLQPEFSQPPLYYLVEAPFAWVAGPQPANLPDWEPQHNPFQDRTDFGNVNLYFHLPREGFPWTGAALGLHLMRLANLLFLAAFVLATYGCAIELGWRRGLALAAATTVGLVPQVAFMAGVLNADNAIAATSAVALYLLLRWLRRGPSARLAALLGLALGAAALSKLSGLAAVGVALGFMGVRATLAWRRPHPASPTAVGEEQGLRDVAITAVVTALVAGWWYIRNWLTLGDPLGWSAMLPATGGMLRSTPLSFGAAAVRLLARCYTGLAAFGWANVWLNLSLYRAALLVGAIGLAGALVSAAVRLRRLRLAHWVLPAWVLAFFVSLARWVQVNSAADQWRLLLPIYPALALIVVGGLYTLARRRWRPLVALPAGLLALNVGAMAFTIAPAYAGVEAYSGRIEHSANVRFGNQVELVGFSTPRRNGDVVQVDLYWRALTPQPRDYATDLAALDASGRIAWKQQSMPDEGRAPMTAWQPGELVLDRHRIGLRPGMEGVQTLVLSLLNPLPPGDHLPAANADGQRLENDSVLVGRFLASAPAAAPPAIKDGVAFQDHLELAGHSLSQANGTLLVTLDWAASGTVSRDYTVFVHLVNAAGKQVAQHDGQPGGGAFPTSLLATGMQVADRHSLDVAGLPAGGYRLEVGLYELASGARLPTARGDSSVSLAASLS